MKLRLVLNRDEVNEQIPYAMICETRFGRYWDTSRRRRMWVEQFTESERKQAHCLFNQARLWYLVKGVPDEVVMAGKTYELWQKLGAFCASI